MNDNIAVECCNEQHTTNFCPHCGKALMSHSLHGLLRHCEIHLRGLNRQVQQAKDLDNERHVKSGQNAVDKWQSWSDCLRKVIRVAKPSEGKS